MHLHSPTRRRRLVNGSDRRYLVSLALEGGFLLEVLEGATYEGRLVGRARLHVGGGRAAWDPPGNITQGLWSDDGIGDFG